MNVVEALPYGYELPDDLHKLALVIIDMQRDFVEPGGFGEALGNDVTPLRSIVPTLQELLATFRALGLTIIHTVEGHKSDLSDCPPSKQKRIRGPLKIGDMTSMGRLFILGEPGNDIIPELQPLPGEVVLSKPGKGAFYKTAMEDILKQKGITHLLITGVTTEVCVQTTMREANDRGYECLMIEDATESYFPEFKKLSLAMIHAQGGIVGWVAPAANVIQALTKASSIAISG